MARESEVKGHVAHCVLHSLLIMELVRRRSQSERVNETRNKRKNSDAELPAEKIAYVEYLRRLFLDQSSSNSYVLTRILFVRLLGLVYTFSFLAAYHQAPVLIGYQGLYPAYLHIRRTTEQSLGLWQSPSIFYVLPAMDTSDACLRVICALGIFIGMFLLFTGRCNAIMLVVLWCFHTSLLNIGQVFYGYGWETQILETTFLAVFLVPVYSLSKIDRSSPPSILFIFLMRFLIARIMLGAGLIKIRGDQCWRDRKRPLSSARISTVHRSSSSHLYAVPLRNATDPQSHFVLSASDAEGFS